MAYSASEDDSPYNHSDVNNCVAAGEPGKAGHITLPIPYRHQHRGLPVAAERREWSAEVYCKQEILIRGPDYGVQVC